MTAPIDFGSEEGFTQAAPKKKKKAPTPSWNGAGKDESKKDEGDGNNGDDKSGDKADGNTGAGASGDGDGDKKDDVAKDAESVDDWGDFMPPKAKKKGKKAGKIEEVITAPDPPPAVEFDAFHEISLDAGPSLDLSFGDTSMKSPSFGSWGSSWNTGTTG